MKFSGLNRVLTEEEKNEYMKEMMTGYKILEDPYMMLLKYTTYQIRCVNRCFVKFLESIFENNEKMLEEDKILVENYFLYFYSETIENLVVFPEGKNVIKYLNKILLYGLPGREDDYEYITDMYKDDLARKVKLNFRKKIETTDKELDDILATLTGTTLNYTEFLKNKFSEMSERGYDIYHSKAMKEYIENFVLTYSQKISPEENNLQKNEGLFGIVKQFRTILNNSQTKKSDTEIQEQKQFEFVLKYVNGITKNSREFNIFCEQGVSDILQMVYCNKFTSKQSKEILGVVSRNLKLSRIDKKEIRKKLGEYISKNEYKIVRSEIEFDRVLSDIQKLKLTNSLKLDRKYINFILRQTLDLNSAVSRNPTKYQCVIERTIEDFSRNDLSSKIKKDGNGYCYFIRDNIGKKYSLGTQVNEGNIILYKRQGIRDLLYKRDLDIFATVFHENEHADQFFDMLNGNYNNYTRYMANKEIIIMKEDSEFYVANYELMFLEIEAREKELYELGRYIYELKVDRNTDYRYGSLRSNIIRKISDKLAEENSKYEKGEEKKLKLNDDKKIKVSNFFDYLISKNPGYLEMFPKLKIEYNDDGSLKTIEEFMLNIQNCQSVDDASLYRSILKKGNIFRREGLPEDLLFLSEYMPEAEYENKNSLVNGLYGIIISDNIGRMIKEAVENIDEYKPRRLLRLKKAFEKVEVVIQEGKNIPFINGMVRNDDNKGKSSLEIMREAHKIVIDKIVNYIPSENEFRTPIIAFPKGNRLNSFNREVSQDKYVLIEDMEK